MQAGTQDLTSLDDNQKEIVSQTFAAVRPICAHLALVVAAENVEDIKRVLLDLKKAVDRLPTFGIPHL